MTQQPGPDRYVLCVSAGAYPVSLEPRKLYRLLPALPTQPENFLRVVDESGEDYLFPQNLFAPIELPGPTAASDAVRPSPSPKRPAKAKSRAQILLTKPVSRSGKRPGKPGGATHVIVKHPTRPGGPPVTSPS